LFQLSNGCCRIELIFVYQLFGVFLTDRCSAVVLRYFLWKRLFYPGDFAVDILQCTFRVVPRNVLKKAT
jgi:hypothetical protein